MKNDDSEQIIRKMNDQIRNIASKYAEKFGAYNSKIEKLGDVIIQHDKADCMNSAAFLTQKDLINFFNGKNTSDCYPFDGCHSAEDMFDVYSFRVLEMIRANMRLLIALKRDVKPETETE